MRAFIGKIITQPPTHKHTHHLLILLLQHKSPPPPPPRLHTWLANSTHEADQCDVGGPSRLQRDGMHSEVLQHVKDGLEPQVLHAALTVLVQGQTQVLRAEVRDLSNTGPAACTNQNQQNLSGPPGWCFHTHHRLGQEALLAHVTSRGCCLTLALPWKLKVRTYSPRRVSLWRTRKTPWLAGPPASTSWAALRRERVPWNH